MIPSDQEVEAFIDAAFERNFDLLRLEAGHSLAPEPRRFALRQVRWYWRKLKSIATAVTDTEVRLILPFQVSPSGKTIFSIEGIVDIVRDDRETIMYDVKTHDREFVDGNVEQYAAQLNVYAHIWQHLRGQPLDRMALIVTMPRRELRDVIRRAVTDAEIENHPLFIAWNPVVPINFDPTGVDDTIADFGTVVEQIENHEFAPCSVDRLKEDIFKRIDQDKGEPKQMRPGIRFATWVCRNCDARFSCASYRTYALGSGGLIEQKFAQFFNDFGEDDERDAFVEVALETQPDPETYEEE
jgi:hypothetical protein